MIASSQSLDLAARPGFLLLKEIRATILSLDTCIDTKIQLHYDDDHHLCGAHHYRDGRMVTAVTYRKDTLDPLGMVIYGADGQVAQIHTHSYDENGNLRTITGTDAAGAVLFSKAHCYDRNGILDHSEIRFNGDLHHWESFHSDKNGLRDLFIMGDAQRKTIHVHQYQNVMEKGRLVKILTHHNGELQRTTVYDEHGRPVTQVRFDSDQQEMDVTRYTYTENGALLLETQTRYGEEICRVEHSYDEAGRSIRIRRIRHGQLEQDEQYTYLNGCLLGHQSFIRGRLDVQYSYVYDPVHISDAQATVLSGLYATLITQ